MLLYHKKILFRGLYLEKDMDIFILIELQKCYVLEKNQIYNIDCCLVSGINEAEYSKIIKKDIFKILNLWVYFNYLNINYIY